MLAAIKDLITAIAATTILTYSTGQQEWLWKHIVALQHKALINAQKNLGCPSIFDKDSCKRIR
ncbi:MAG TPA: hypothetical protein VIG33_11680 [Pseudobdellovibrionaceae bacterium]|jgi:hypothetical protein